MQYWISLKGNSMVKTFNTFQPQLNEENAVALSNEAKLSLYKKSQKSSIPVNVLEEVYRRGYSIWNESFVILQSNLHLIA